MMYRKYTIHSSQAVARTRQVLSNRNPEGHTERHVSTLTVEARQLSLGFIRPENLVSHTLRVLSVLCWKHPVDVNFLHSGEASVWTPCHEAQINGLLQWWLPFLKCLPSLTQKSLWSSARDNLGFLVTSLTKALSCWSLSLAVGYKLLPFMYPRGHCGSSKPSTLQTCFCGLSLICASTQSCLWALRADPLIYPLI